jgi:peptide/nickel transport system substrate-binding protein
MARDRATVRLTRRQMVSGLSAMGALALAACGGTAPTPTSAPSTSSTAPTPVVFGTQQPTAIPQIPTLPPTAPSGTAASGGAATATRGSSPVAVSTPSSAPSAAPAGQKGGAIRFPVGSDPVPNPITVPGGLASIFSNKLIFNSLIRYNSRTLNPEGDLAERWDFSSDGKELTFKLRSGVKWHDGQPFTADDVKFTFDTMLDTKVTARFRSNIRGVQEVQVVDPLTVKLKLANPLPSLPIQLGYNVHMAPKHILQGQDINAPADFLKKPIGTGQFKLVEYTPGSTMTLERNDAFHFGAPLLDRITLRVVADINAQLAQLKSGELDFMLMEPDQAASVKGTNNIVIQNAAQVNYYYIAYNNTRPLFSDKRVRQALTMAINREDIVKNVLGGAGKVAYGPINPLLAWAYTEDVQKWPFNVEMAKKQLDDAGWVVGSDGIRAKDGQRFSFEVIVDKGNTSRESTAAIAQQSWKAVGVEAKINTMEFNASLDRFNKGDYDSIVEWYITPPDPDVSAWFGTGGTSNLWKYSSPQADDLLNRARSEIDQAKSGALYKEFLKVVAEDQPITFNYFPQEIRGLASRLQNVPPVGIRDAIVYAYQWSVNK